MKEVLALLKMFGERYVFCSQEQSIFDSTYLNEERTEAFMAILSVLRERVDNDEQ